MKTGYKLYPSEWDPKEQRPAYRGVRVRRVGVLGTLIERIESDKRLFANIIASLAKEGDFTVDMVVDRFNLGYRQRSFSYFMQSLSVYSLRELTRREYHRKKSTMTLTPNDDGTKLFHVRHRQSVTCAVTVLIEPENQTFAYQLNKSGNGKTIITI